MWHMTCVTTSEARSAAPAMPIDIFMARFMFASSVSDRFDDARQTTHPDCSANHGKEECSFRQRHVFLFG
jgi:hypothetical protein